jgi:hypothetical protein
MKKNKTSVGQGDITVSGMTMSPLLDTIGFQLLRAC